MLHTLRHMLSTTLLIYLIPLILILVFYILRQWQKTRHGQERLQTGAMANTVCWVSKHRFTFDYAECFLWACGYAGTRAAAANRINDGMYRCWFGKPCFLCHLQAFLAMPSFLPLT